jgi:putative peptidoglycan lipid II flippase
MMIVFLTNVFYSRNDTKTPVVLSGACVGINVVGNIILTRVMGIGGIALSTSITFFVNALLLIAVLRKHSREAETSHAQPLFGRAFAARTLKILLAAICAIACSYPIYQGVNRLLDPASSLTTLLCLLAAAVVGAGVYYALLHLFKVEEIRLIRELLPKKNHNRNAYFRLTGRRSSKISLCDSQSI